VSLPDLLPALRQVLTEFDRMGIGYYVGGSVASSIYGEPRSTLDVDIGADLSESIVPQLISHWGREFYVSEPAMREAVRRARCFNLIHLATSLKVDIFVCGADAFNASVLKRRVSQPVAVGDESLTIWLATPEDVILHKLAWYRKGGEISERQWRDICGVLKQQRDRLDTSYLAEWADRLLVRDLWERCRNSVTPE
jgi:hypothetical protein